MRWFRWMHLGVVVAMVGAVAVLSLSESPSGPLNEVASGVGDMARRAAMVSGRRGGGHNPLPIGQDKILHFLGWSAVGFAAAGLTARFTDRINLVLGLLTVSAVFEVGQRYLTESRSAEFADLVANGTGLLVGLVAFVISERLVDPLLPRGGPPFGPLRRGVPIGW